MIIKLTVGPPHHDLAQLFVNLSIATLTLRNMYVWGLYKLG